MGGHRRQQYLISRDHINSPLTGKSKIRENRKLKKPQMNIISHMSKISK